MSGSASRAKIFICEPKAPRDESGLREQDRREPRAARVPSPGDRRGRESADGVLQDGIRDGRLRRRRARCAQRDPGEPAFPLSRGIRSRNRRDSHAERSRTGVASVVLPLEQPAGRRAAEARLGVAAQQTRRAGRAGEPDARRPAREITERRFRLPVAPRHQAGRDHSGQSPVPARERTAGSARDVQGGTAAVHRQRAAQRSQRLRPADRGLHLPQRASWRCSTASRP